MGAMVDYLADNSATQMDRNRTYDGFVGMCLHWKDSMVGDGHC